MSDTYELEMQLKNAKELVSQRDLALKLSENYEFRTLILEGFCQREAARLVGLSADPALDLQQRADALSMGQAAGHLRRYLSMMVTMGNTAEREIPLIEANIVEAQSEEDAE